MTLWFGRGAVPSQSAARPGLCADNPAGALAALETLRKRLKKACDELELLGDVTGHGIPVWLARFCR